MFTKIVQLFSHKDGQFSPSSPFRKSSGYVFFKIWTHIFKIFEVKLE